MSKKTIVLADNSYTIRRIVELSFSEEVEIQLVSFEDGANLKEQLFELKPEIVLVDIKLPEFSGYEVCKFINTTESLKNTKVFLLKGGFEPIDESLLTNLVYASIITKPFDSNALVATIKKILSAPPKRTPASIPEETPSFASSEIPDLIAPSPPGNEMNFSAVNDDLGADGILSDREARETQQYHPSDEVLPSEEITQGTQPEIDSLAPSRDEDLVNPFAEDTPVDRATQKTMSEEELDIKMNIQQQERDLDIESLTQEEIKITKHIGDFGKPVPGPQAGITGETGNGSVGLGDLELDIPAPGITGDVPVKEKEIFPRVSDSQPGVKTGEAENYLQKNDSLRQKDFGIPGPSEMEKYPEIEQALGQENIDFEKEITVEPGIMDSAPSPEVKPEFVDFAPRQEIQEPSAPAPPQVRETPTQADVGDVGMFGDEGPEEEIEFEIPGMGVPAAAESKPIEDFRVEPAPADILESRLPQEVDLPPVERAAAPQEELDGIPIIRKEELLYKVEDKLTLAIKEILWDIVPPMAEKIIKSEIEKLKTEVDKSFEYIDK
jgi:CheY-like chemotaxis protein